MNTLENNANVSDPLDQASNVQQLEITALLSSHKPMYSGISAEFCKAKDAFGDDCGEPIPERRRKGLPGVDICVDCASAKERKNGR